MRLYHATLAGLADLIIENGFDDRSPRDTPGDPGTFFADQPVTGWDSTGSEYTTLVVDVPDDVALKHEIHDRYPGDEDSGFREFLLPAAVVNRYEIRRLEP